MLRYSGSVDEPGISVRLLRRAIPFLAAAILVAAIYDGVIFWGRWRQARDARNAAILKEGQDAQRVIDRLGGDRLKILTFYASPITVHRGQTASICYGVNAAKSVRIEPPVEQLYPAYSHCFEVNPRRDTEYRLTATDAAGHTVAQVVTIQVKP